jgi:translation initiation factor 3 subunit H
MIPTIVLNYGGILSGILVVVLSSSSFSTSSSFLPPLFLRFSLIIIIIIVYFFPSLVQNELSSETIFEEVPIVLHNMNLVNALIYELEDANLIGPESHLFEASETPYLERVTSLMIENIDALTSEQGKFQQYYRNLMKQQQQQAGFLHRRQQENAHRIAQGLPPIEEEDLSQNPLFRPLPEPNRLDFMLLSSQLHHYTDQAYTDAEQIYRKFHIASLLGK